MSMTRRLPRLEPWLAREWWRYARLEDPSTVRGTRFADVADLVEMFVSSLPFARASVTTLIDAAPPGSDLGLLGAGPLQDAFDRLGDTVFEIVDSLEIPEADRSRIRRAIWRETTQHPYPKD